MNHRFSLIGIAAALYALTSPVSAAVVLYDFEGQPIPTETPFILTSGGISATFSGPSTVDPGAFGIASNFASPTGFQYRLMNGDFLTIGSAFGASGSPLQITFSVPVSALTFSFALDDPANLSTLALSTNGGGTAAAAGLLASGFRYPEGTFSFSGAPFTSLTLRTGAIDFQLDNLQATIAAVPEPGSLLLLGAGLFVAALVRRPTRPAA